MTPARHKCARCPSPPAAATGTALPLVTKGSAPLQEQQEEGSGMAGGTSSPCLLCGPDSVDPVPLSQLRRGKGQRRAS